MQLATVAPPTPSLDPRVLRVLATRTHLMAATMLVVTATFIIAKTGRDALYFANGGILDLPRAYIGIALLSLPVAFGALALMRTIGPRRARVVAPLALAAMLARFAVTAHPAGGAGMTGFFMVVTLAFGALFSMIWLLAADLFQGAPAERLARAYREIGAASILGGVVGGAIARALAPHVEPQQLVLLAAGLLLVAAVGMAAIQGRCAPGGLRRVQATVRGHAAPAEVAPEVPLETLPVDGTRMPAVAPARMKWAGAGHVLRDRYTTRLLVVGMLAAAVGVLIEFQFYLTIAALGRGGRNQAGLFANAYLLLNGLALALQFWVLPWLQRTVGPRGALLVLPGVLLGGGVALLASASVALRAALRVTEGGLKSSIHRTSWEQAFLPFDPGRRPLAKLIVDGGGAHAAEGLTAGVLLLWMRDGTEAAQLARSGVLLAIGVVVCAGLWLRATMGIRADNDAPSSPPDGLFPAMAPLLPDH